MELALWRALAETVEEVGRAAAVPPRLGELEAWREGLLGP